MISGKSDIFISIVSPVYKAEAIVEELVAQIEIYASRITSAYEIILVEDGGKDNSWKKIETICKANTKVKGIKLSRNFGQHHAISAGLDQSSGEWVVVMDCDLQDNPAEMQNMLQKAQAEKLEIVLAQRIERQDSFLKKQTSKLFYRAFSYLTGMQQDGTVANFGIYSRKVISAIQEYKEPFRFFPAFVNLAGFAKGYYPVQHQARFAGESSYNWSRLIKLASSVIIAHSDKPLRLTVKLGFILSASAIAMACFYLIRYMTGKIIISGFASLIISIWFIGGLNIFVLGIIGLYLGRAFEATKNRPVYLIDKKLNSDVR